jgi:hypothetical protein
MTKKSYQERKKRGQLDAPDATVPSTNQEQKEESDKRNKG